MNEATYRVGGARVFLTYAFRDGRAAGNVPDILEQMEINTPVVDREFGKTAVLATTTI